MTSTAYKSVLREQSFSTVTLIGWNLSWTCYKSVISSYVNCKSEFKSIRPALDQFSYNENNEKNTFLAVTNLKI
jgi:hypothetical protein